MTTYTPQPGTIPYRIITWLKLQPKGSEYTSAQLAEELEILAPTICTSLDYPRKLGAVACRKDPSSGWLYWSLGNGLELPKPADYEPDKPLRAHSEAKEGRKRRKGTSLFIPVLSKSEKAAVSKITAGDGAPDLVVGKFSDGSMRLVRAPGNHFDLSPADTAVLVDFVRSSFKEAA